MVQTQSTPELDVDVRVKRWTIEDYHRMIQAGILTSDDRVELLDGYIVEMVPQDPPHASITSIFSNDIAPLFSGKAWVRSQLPITIAPNSEPEPDIAIVRIDQRRYRDRHPNPDDIYLLIEVADSTLRSDRNRKAKIYARAKIPEYWIVDVNQQQVFVFRDPQGEAYQSEQVFDATTTLSPLAFPDVSIELQQLFS